VVDNFSLTLHKGQKFPLGKGNPVILISGHPDAERIVLQHEPVILRVSKPATLECLQSAIEHALTEKGVPRRPK
jgi:hypothetical protein